MQGLFFGLREGVLDAEHDVGAGAAAGRLLQEVAAGERRRQARHRAVAHPPRFTVVVRLPVALVVGAVPDHFLRPGEREAGRQSAASQLADPSTSRRSSAAAAAAATHHALSRRMSRPSKE